MTTAEWAGVFAQQEKSEGPSIRFNYPWKSSRLGRHGDDSCLDWSPPAATNPSLLCIDHRMFDGERMRPYFTSCKVE